MTNMNQYIKNVVKRMYQIDVDTASKEQLEAIEEINVSDITMNSEVTTWNFSEFPNLKKIDCSYLFIKDLITTGCTELEYLRWEGVRGNDIHLDLSTNKKLKKVVGGQGNVGGLVDQQMDRHRQPALVFQVCHKVQGLDELPVNHAYQIVEGFIRIGNAAEQGYLFLAHFLQMEIVGIGQPCDLRQVESGQPDANTN